MTSDGKKHLYVWAYLPGEAIPAMAGRLSVENSPSVRHGVFQYSKSYLANPNAFSLDPIKLPLNETKHEFTALGGFPSALLDSCPDNWGIRVIHQLSGEKDVPEGYLLMNDPGRVGALAFTEDKRTPIELSSREFSIGELLKAAESVESGDPVDEELLRALNPGTGGARPKCNIVYKGQLWIAKFPSSKDLAIVSQPRIEHAVMTLAGICGLDVAQTELIQVDGKDVCLVRRFDRKVVDGAILRQHYLSARTLFYADDNFNKTGLGSYQRLARWLQRYVANNAQSKLELYKRMVFNVAVRNSDDHELNHGLIHVRDNEYRLSPAFDISPIPSSNLVKQHALLIGSSGDGTISALLEAAEGFSISQDIAFGVIEKMQSQIAEHWLDNLYSCGFDDAQVAAVSGLFRPIPYEKVAKANRKTI
ncbi:MAG: hypothetical protein CTY38_01125 [Methylotenera sp.]|uniref:type II toxin-antitoxin system HipA family toxin n=1 Tax=Methylotenera sp. TaxID=2051956 RepID=UPI000D45D1A8|nr:HipA domain-containing protein [Methylotenera sp.]PPC84679.1 MAG: hypothetical protein CTY38_01125 [Methylotenera sp.]